MCGLFTIIITSLLLLNKDPPIGGSSKPGKYQFLINIASVGQACAQNEQPMQFFASTRVAIWRTW